MMTGLNLVNYLFVLLFATLSQSTFAKTYFACTNNHNYPISFTDLPAKYHDLKDEEDLFLFNIQDVGMTHNFFIPKSQLKVDKLIEYKHGKTYDVQILSFLIDDFNYRITQIKSDDDKRILLERYDLHDDIDDNYTHQCDMNKPVVFLLNEF